MDCSMPGFPILHHLLEFTQIHVHWSDDAIQPSHPLSSPSPPAFNLSQHQVSLAMSQLFSPGGQSIGASASILAMNIQDWFPLGLTGLICTSDSQESSPAPQFMTTGKTIVLTLWTFVGNVMSLLFCFLIRCLGLPWASLVAQLVKNLPAMQRPWFNYWVRKMPWRRQWQPTSVFLPGKSHGQRSLVD